MSIHLPFKSLNEYIRIAEKKLEDEELFLNEQEDGEVLAKRLKRRKGFLNVVTVNLFIHAAMWLLILQGGETFQVTLSSVFFFKFVLLLATAINYFAMKPFLLIKPSEQEGFSLMFFIQVFFPSWMCMLLFGIFLPGGYQLLPFVLYFTYSVELLLFCLYIDTLRLWLKKKREEKE